MTGQKSLVIGGAEFKQNTTDLSVVFCLNEGLFICNLPLIFLTHKPRLFISLFIGFHCLYHICFPYVKPHYQIDEKRKGH